MVIYKLCTITKTLIRMIRPFTIILIAIIIASCSQKDKPKKTEFEKAKEELQDRFLSGNMNDFVKVDDTHLDDFIKAVKENKLDTAYTLIDDLVKKMQTKEEIENIFSLYKTHYGQIIDYNRTSFGVQEKPGVGKIATVTYEVQFEKYKGKSKGSFKVYEDNKFKMVAFDFALNDYSEVASFARIISPALNAINKKDKKAIYNLTSARFKEYNSIANFESSVSKIFENNLKDLKMFRHQLGIKNGNEILNIYFEPSDKAGYLQLSFAKTAGKFELEGLNFRSN